MDIASPLLLRSERRQRFRVSVTYPAMIYAGNNMALHPCTVLDISQRGGRIKLDDDGPLPDDFILLFTKTGNVRRNCRLIWRQGAYLGVEFFARFDHH